MSERDDPRSSRGRWAIGVVVLLLLAQAAVAQARRPTVLAPAEPAARLYVSADASSEPFVPLNPATLADVDGVTPLDLGDAAGGWWRLSEDGSTVAAAEFGDRAVDVRAGLGGYQTLREANVSARRAGPGGPWRVDVASVFLSAFWLSRDGSRIVVEGLPADEVGAPAPVLERSMVWSLYDAADGRLLNRVRIGGEGG